LDYVLQLRKREDPDNQILNNIKQAGNQTIGDLRKLTDHDWIKMEVPALCRIYLKFLIRQSARGVNTQKSSTTNGDERNWSQLEADFNNGSPFEMSSYAPKLKKLEEMSFSKNIAMEALLISGNVTVEAALEVLMLNPMDKAARRAAAMAGNTYTTSGGPPTPRGPSNDSINFQRQLEREKTARQKVEEELKSLRNHLPKDIYKGYVRGLLSTELITAPEIEKLKKIREELGFTEREHNEVLAELGLTPNQFDEMKSSEMRRDKDCVICLENPKTHVIFDCMHLCLCDECVEPYAEKRQKKCPICTKKITRVARIFM